MKPPAAPPSPTVVAVLADQRIFLVLAALAGVARVAFPAGGAAATWATIGALWLGGALLAAWRSRGDDRGWLVARIGIQNAAIQVLVALPSIARGLLRMAAEATDATPGAAFVSNALVTVVALPALSAVVLTCAALVVAVPGERLFRALAPTVAILAMAVSLPPAGLTAAPRLDGLQTACGDAATVEIDHVPVAVRDLEAAAGLFEDLGFALKPGRPHDNGLRNVHAKFRDGREIELITITGEPVDELGHWYAERITVGPGPVFLALHAGPVRDVARALSDESARMRTSRSVLSFPPGHRWRHLFFGQLNASPTDQPEHFAHANGAITLEAVWIAGGAEAETELVSRFGGERCAERVELPGAGSAAVVGLRDSRLYVTAGPAIHADRSLVGLTVTVRDLVTAREALASRGIDVHEGEVAGRRGLVADLRDPIGAWLEFREAPAHRSP